MSVENLLKEVGGLSANVETLIKVFDKVSKEISEIKPILQEKASREDLDEIKKSFGEFEVLFKIHLENLLLDSKEIKEDTEKNKSKISELEFSVWKLGFLTTTGGVVGGSIIKLIDFFTNYLK